MSESEKPVVIVTGSSGMIGSKVVKRLAGQYRIAGFDRPGQPVPPDPAVAIDVDLGEDDSVDAAVRRTREEFGAKVASIVHLAAYYDFSGEPSPLYQKITIDGTRRLLDAIDRENVAVEQIVFSSTMLVHATTQPGRPIDESWPLLEDAWDYPASKIATERLIRERRGDTKAVLLRIAGVYDDEGHSPPLVNQIQRIWEERMTSRFFPGDPAHGQAFVHLDDAVDAIARSVDRRARLPAEVAILIGEDRTLSYDQLQHEFARLLHGDEESFETRRIPEPVAKVGAWVKDKLPGESFIKPWMIPHADDHYELDITRARKLLGWEPRHALRESLPKMVEALKRDPSAWYREHELEPPKEFPSTSSSRS